MILILFFLIFVATAVRAKVQFAGVNIAGFDFGCNTDGTCNISTALPPLKALNGPDGAGQMSHFAKDDELNMFRLPVGWQFLLDNVLGGTLDATNFGKYDELVQACLSTGSYCIVDVHNYARFNGLIIAQDDGGPTDEQFADLWAQIAAKYQSESKLVFGIMNEPHDVPNITRWAETVQAAVTAIRETGATEQMILLPGNNFTSALAFIENGSAGALSAVRNPDGSNTSLIFDVHQYLDVDNSGTHQNCTSNHVKDAFMPLAAFLRENGRQAILSETGGGNDTTCFTDLCAETSFLNDNPDVFLGYVGWAAGGFDTSYVLSLTPTEEADGKFVDNKLAAMCIVGTRSSRLGDLVDIEE